MRVLVAGAGPVGRSLAGALAAASVEVVRWSRGEPVAGPGRAAGPGAPAPAAPEKGPGGGAGAGELPALAVLAVRDAAVSSVAARLLDEGRLGSPAILVHTAGALPPSQAFSAVRDRAGGIALLHPLRAFAATATARDLAGTVFAIAGDAAGRTAALDLCARLGGIPLVLEEPALPAYHAAAALAANHTLALVDAAVALLQQQGLDRAIAATALAGLLRSAADNVAALGLPEALTGPIARGDDATVARHLAALPPDLVPLYRETALATLDLARRLGRGDEAGLRRLAILLGRGGT